MWARIWAAIRRGEHVELYLVLIVSSIAALLALINVGSDRLISTLTVTAIGLTGFALLEQRTAVQGALDDIRATIATAHFQDSPPYALEEVLSSSKLVMLAGVDLARTFSNFESSLRRYAAAGNTLHVMLYEPGGQAVDYAIMRSTRPFSRDRQIGLIQSGAEDFLELQKAYPQNVTVRLSSAPFPHGIVASDFHNESGYICLKHYTYKCDNYDRPWFRLTSADGRWYKQFAQEISAFWSDAYDAKVALSPQIPGGATPKTP